MGGQKEPKIPKRESEKQKTDNNQIKNIVISKTINTNGLSGQAQPLATGMSGQPQPLATGLSEQHGHQPLATGLSGQAHPLATGPAVGARESESSIQYIGKDDEYEDVFSNVLESHGSDNHSVNKNTINTINNRDDIKRKDVYFSKFNGL